MTYTLVRRLLMNSVIYKFPNAYTDQVRNRWKSFLQRCLAQ